jgi:hypothetical protein
VPSAIVLGNQPSPLAGYPTVDTGAIAAPPAATTADFFATSLLETGDTAALLTTGFACNAFALTAFLAATFGAGAAFVLTTAFATGFFGTAFVGVTGFADTGFLLATFFVAAAAFTAGFDFFEGDAFLTSVGAACFSTEASIKNFERSLTLASHAGAGPRPLHV